MDNKRRRIEMSDKIEDRKKLPTDVNTKDMDFLEIGVTEFVESRAREMEAMAQMSKVVTKNNLVAQQLPRHMRRRAASHNMKRLPRRLHAAALQERTKTSGSPATSKRPSRRYRRRHDNEERAARRARGENAWLETHVWHAKRFAMVSRWGYRLALHPNDKGVRAAYRASAHHCLLQDLSYLCCVQLCGDQTTLEAGLRQLCHSDTGLTVAARQYACGSRHGRTVLFRPAEYPQGAIAEVQFLWQPVSGSGQAVSGSDQRRLWLWVHPAAHSELLLVLEQLASIEVTSLKDKLVHFRLTGPRSQAILAQTLVPADVHTGGDTQWWARNYKAKSAHDAQSATWASLRAVQSPGELPPRCVLGLTVRDPRLLRPAQRMGVSACANEAMDSVNDINDTETSVSYSELTKKLPIDTHLSALWDSDVRSEVKETQISDAKINEKRSENLVPGSAVSLGDCESRIPVLLLQRSGCSGGELAGYGAGWDVILPAGWGKAFWLALVYRGARAGGLREQASVALQSARLSFPQDYPDTTAGKTIDLETERELTETHARRPPAKRPNHTRLGAATPFKRPWATLLADWSEAVVPGGVFVCRCRRSLGTLTAMCHKRKKPDELCLSAVVLGKSAQCIVPVKLRVTGRGNVEPFTMLALPSADDLTHKSVDPITEPLHKPDQPLSRRLVGYVSCGDFALAVGHGRGVGFVALNALLELVNTQTGHVQVLTRGAGSSHYKWASLEILL